MGKIVTPDVLRLPRYEKLPTLGLYLDQVADYINNRLAPLGDVRLTTTMISAYVKHHLLPRPIKRQYGRDHLAKLIFIAAAKNILSLATLRVAVQIQEESHATPAQSYDCFCDELENAYLVANHQPKRLIVKARTDQQRVLHSLALAIAYHAVVDRYFHAISADL